MVDTTSDVLGGTFSNEAINELPLQGRDFQNLAILQPGIQRTPGGGFESITANGNRPQDNNFIVDEIDDNDAYYGVTVINAEGVQGTPATHLPIDAIQEFNVQSSPEADYGWKPGAIINIGIKSGTNTLHGTAYYFNRNAALDARNWFNPASAPVSALNLHQFGPSAGGPIIKDKLFIFGNYEGVRDKVGNPLLVSTPVTVSIGDPTISIADAFAECAAAATCSAISEKLATLLPYNPGPTTALNLDFNNVNREDNGILKLDYHLSERHTLTGSYFVGDSVQTEEDSTVLNPLFLSQAYTRAQVIGGGWIWAPNARLTNQFHIGYNRFSQQVVVGDHSLNPATFGINTGVTNPTDFGLPEIRISGFTSHTIGGNGSWPLYTTPNQTLQFSDNVTYVIGTHNLRFGGEVRSGSTDNLRDTYGPGFVRFNTDGPASPLENFTTGDAGYAYVAVGNSHRVVSQKSLGAYIQDDWRTTQRLTITAGLRYDLSLPITDSHDQLANFDPVRGLVQVGKQISAPYNTDYNNFAPRLGLAFDPGGKGKTVIRAGAGIIYEIPHITVYIGQNSTQAQGLALIPTGLALIGPNGQVPSPGNIDATTVTLTDTQVSSNWKADGPIFGNLSPGAVSCAYQPANGIDNPCPVFGVNRNIVTPYVINWNFNLEQALWHDAAMTIAYVGNKGVKLYSISDINQNNYAVDQANNQDEQSGRPFLNRFPYLSFIDMLGNGDNSIYHGLQVTVRQRTSKGLYFVAGYSWAHSIDDSSGNREFTIQDSNNPAVERSNSDTDIRHRLTLAMTYELPSKPGYGQLLKGWRVNSIFTAQTGEPLFFFDSSNDISGTGEFNDRWNFSGDPSKIHWSPDHPIPFYPYDGTAGSTNPACDAVAEQSQLSSDGCFAGPGWVITPPNPGQFGNMGRNIVYGPACRLGFFDPQDIHAGRTGKTGIARRIL
jgi:TonB dependent receptor